MIAARSCCWPGWRQALKLRARRFSIALSMFHLHGSGEGIPTEMQKGEELGLGVGRDRDKESRKETGMKSRGGGKLG